MKYQTSNYDLLRLTTKDHIILNSLYAKGDKAKTASIFIHGFTGDFYGHEFYHLITSRLRQQSNAIIFAQTRGAGKQTEFLKTDGSTILIGSYNEKLEDAHLDISSYVQFLLEQGYKDIALIGHSMGTIKAARYLFEGEYKEKISKLVLLAPYDKNGYLENRSPGKMRQFMRDARQKITQGKAKDPIPVPLFDDYPLTYETFYSWYQNTPLNLIFDFYKKSYNSPMLQKIKIPVKVILGETDEFTNYPQFNETSGTVLEILKKTIPACDTTLIPKCDHIFTGFEEEVAKQISGFVGTQKNYQTASAPRLSSTNRHIIPLLLKTLTLTKYLGIKRIQKTEKPTKSIKFNA
jgi:pimeloyl-ACP methyl ester carboxylesterase